MNNRSGAKSSRGKVLLIGLIIAVLIAIAIFVFGFIKGRAQVSIVQGQLAQAQAQLVISQNQQYLMQADIALYRTATDLDQRNFGIANSRLKSATDALGKISQTAAGVNSAQITQLRNSISAMNINVATNLEDQRAQVLKFASQLDGLMGK
jgi:hypothetical protein